MNERIIELAEQAGMIVGDAGEFDMAKFMPKEVKFAQLIVMECTKILADNGEFRGCVIIGKHFKVEE